MNGIRDVVREEQPRERLLLEGIGSLSNRELLAVLLRTGSKEETVLKLSDKILHHFDGLRMLKDATLEELISIHGVGIAKASQLMAAFELGRRMVRLEYQNRYSIRRLCEIHDGRTALFTTRAFCLFIFKYKKSSYT